MAVGPDFRIGARLADEWIVRRDAAIRRDAHDLAEIVVERLRHIAVGEMFAVGEEQIAVGALRDAAAEVVAARGRALLAVDHLDVGEARIVSRFKPRARQRRAAAVLERGGVGKIDGAVLREVAVERDIEQPALTGGEDLRHAGQRRRQFAVARHDAHAAGPLGDQHASVGQEGERPGMHQAAGDGFDLEISAGGFERLLRRRRGRREQQEEAERHCDPIHARHAAANARRWRIAFGVITARSSARQRRIGLRRSPTA